MGDGERIEKDTEVLELGADESMDISVQQSDSVSLSTTSARGSGWKGKGIVDDSIGYARRGHDLTESINASRDRDTGGHG